MTTRLSLRRRGRSGLVQRIEALEAWRQQLPTAAQYKTLNLAFLPDDLLKKLAPVVKLIAVGGMEALQPEQQAVLNETSDFYGALKAKGVDIYMPPKAPA